LWTLALWLLLFFVAFNVLEATLPSLVSRTAPPTAKGAALGVYNTTQAIGLFVGGAGGGYLAQNFGDNAVFATCTGLVLIWLAVANSMNFPQRRVAAATQSV
jgi:predicted MFS family arabinose efflux permease